MLMDGCYIGLGASKTSDNSWIKNSNTASSSTVTASAKQEEVKKE